MRSGVNDTGAPAPRKTGERSFSFKIQSEARETDPAGDFISFATPDPLSPGRARIQAK